MNFEEFAAKPLLAAAGIAVPPGRLVHTPADARTAAAGIGACVVKAQVPTGKRGLAGGIKAAATPADAEARARDILGMTIAGHQVDKLLIEAQADIAGELYAAVLNDPATKGPLILFSAQGGMDVEELAANHPDRLVRLPVDIRHGITADAIAAAIRGEAGDHTGAVAALLATLYGVYAAHDAELLEINPLAVLGDGSLCALDCKLVLDDSAIPRHPDLAAAGTPERLTSLEARGREHGLKYIELDGDIGVLANGAGLTMTTMDVIRHHGGRPANFLEIGGEAYRLGKPALGLVLDNPKVKSLVVNFCGAFARTDVMTAGILEAWAELKPDLPVFFSIHGTGEDAAQAMVRDRLGLEPHDLMDDAVTAAIRAAKEAAQ